MLQKIAAEIKVLLNKNEFVAAVDVMREWGTTCTLSEVYELIGWVEPHFRPRLTELLRDTLSQYPQIILGCPMLYYACADHHNNYEECYLPNSLPIDSEPCPSLSFLGWMPLGNQMTMPTSRSVGVAAVKFEWRVPTGAIAIFRLQSPYIDFEKIEIPGGWWDKIFMQTVSKSSGFNVRIEGDMLLSYPGAIEVALAQQAGARRESIPGVAYFQESLTSAYETGSDFLNNCIHTGLIESK